MERLSSNCNIAFTKIWSDDSCQENLFIELSIDVWSPHSYMHQEFYADAYTFQNFGQMVVDKSFELNASLAFDFQESGMHPALRLRFFPANSKGIVPVEIDLQVYDNPDENARCRMRIEAEPGMLERFGRAAQRVAFGEVGSVCRLNPDLPIKYASIEDGL